jgi:ribosomal protein S14
LQKVRKALRVDALCSKEFTAPQQSLIIEKLLLRGGERRNKTRLQTRCVYTGAPRVQYKGFKLHRMQLKKMLLDGNVPGYFKPGW